MAKRLVKGRDWHGWAWKDRHSDFLDKGRDGLFFYAHPQRPSYRATDTGRWVKVKFVEVKQAR